MPVSFTSSGYADDKGGYIRQTALNASSTSGRINFTGLGTGTDMNEIANKLVEMESIQMVRLKNWKTTWQAKIDTMTALNQRLLAVEEGADDMRTMNKFLVRQVASSNSTALSAQVNDTAALGAHKVTVAGGTENPIKNIFRSIAFASPTDTCGDDGIPPGSSTELALESGGTIHNITLQANASLQDIADAINAQCGGNITATIENDGTASKPYRLQLVSATGGANAEIKVVDNKNPTWLSFSSQDMLLQDKSNMGVDVAIGGTFTGDKANGLRAIYDFKVLTDSGTPGSTAVVGTNSFKLEYTVTWAGGSPSPAPVTQTITIPANYKPGASIQIENGMSIQLQGGTVTQDDNFLVRGFAGNIDDAETTAWTGPAIKTSGHYLGSINKSYNFVVESGGAINGVNVRYISWTDSTGKTGRFAVKDADTKIEVEQGVYVEFGAGSLKQGERFSLDAYAKDVQAAQDKGVAQAAKVVHAGFADYDVTPVTANNATFSYTYGGKVVDVVVQGGTTLSQLVVAINEDKKNPGVKASMVNDGLGLPNSWKLVLTGSKTGQEYQITNIKHSFTGSSFAGGGELGGGFSTAQRATNSMIRVDGYPSGDEYMQRPYNQIGDAITGVNLNITDAGSSVISVSVNNEQVYSKVEAFVNAVNLVQDYIRESTKFEQTETGNPNAGILIGNYAFYIIKTEVDQLLATKPSGLVAGQDTYTVLAQIGIESDPETGQWMINSSKLKAAISNDAEGVAKLFVNVPNPSDNKQSLSVGVAERAYQKINELTASPSTGTDVNTGKPITIPGGPLNVLISNYTDIIGNIDKKVAQEEKRIALFKQRTMLRFARLETTIANFNSSAAKAQAVIDNLPSNSKK